MINPKEYTDEQWKELVQYVKNNEESWEDWNRRLYDCEGKP